MYMYMYMYTVHVDASVTRRVIVVYTCEAEMLVCKFLYQCDVIK